MEKHRQLKLELEGKIVNGDYPPGSKFPSQNQLIQRKKLSYSTVSRVLRELSEEGYIERVRGQGTFVAEKESWSKRDVEFTIKVVVNPSWFSGRSTELSHLNSFEIYGAIIRRASELKLPVQNIYFDDSVEVNEAFFGIDEFFFLFGSSGYNARMAVELQKRVIPFVVYEIMAPFSAEYNCISENVLWPCYKMTSKVIEAGHEKVVFIGSSRDMGWIEPKEKGYRIAMAENGLTPVSVYVDRGLSSESINQLLENLLGSYAPSALFSYDDSCAVLLLEGLLAKGIRIPEDIAVVGFGNGSQLKFSPVPLTTCDNSREKLGRGAVDLMRFIYQNPEISPMIKSLDCELIFRESFVPLNEDSPDSVFPLLAKDKFFKFSEIKPEGIVK